MSSPSDKNAVARVLRSRLDERRPLDPAVGGALPAPAEGSADHAERSLGEILLDPATPLDALLAIKRGGKRLAEWDKLPAEHAADAAIYYAAIACALVHYETKITGSSYAHLLDSFALLIGESWMPLELAALLVQAHRVCHKLAAGKVGERVRTD